MILDELHGTALTLDPEALSPPLLKRVIAKRDQFDHGMRAIIQQGIDQGVFTPGDPKMIEFAMMGAVNWITKWFDPAGPMTSDQIGERSPTISSADCRSKSASELRNADLVSISQRILSSATRAVSPGFSFSTSIPVPARCCSSCSGVPVSSGNVP